MRQAKTWRIPEGRSRARRRASTVLTVYENIGPNYLDPGSTSRGGGFSWKHESTGS